MNGDIFFDTNVLVYLLSDDDLKYSAAARVLGAGGVISVQVLNEFANVARHKQRRDWNVLNALVAEFRATLHVIPLTESIHEHGLMIAERHKFRIFDSMIIAAVLEAGCRTLYSEDMHHGFVIDGLSIINPFRAAT